jgi:hypothetical protein
VLLSQLSRPTLNKLFVRQEALRRSANKFFVCQQALGHETLSTKVM